MLIGIVGGILQGMEAVYLCRHAGYTSMVIDKRKDAPALSLADRAEVCDILANRVRAKALFSECDAVIPAVENLEVLKFLSEAVPECGTHLLFDLESYKRFFADMGYENVEYDVVDGRMPCAIAVITKPIRRNV